MVTSQVIAYATKRGLVVLTDASIKHQIVIYARKGYFVTQITHADDIYGLQDSTDNLWSATSEIGVLMDYVARLAEQYNLIPYMPLPVIKARTISTQERALRSVARIHAELAIAAFVQAESFWRAGDISRHDSYYNQAEIFAACIPADLRAEFSQMLHGALYRAGYAR